MDQQYINSCTLFSIQVSPFLFQCIHLSRNADEISTSKQYLTSKLVEDSLKWQRDKRTSKNRRTSGLGLDSKSPSPFSSPVHRGAVANTLHSPIHLRIPRPQKLNVNSSLQGNKNVIHPK